MGKPGRGTVETLAKGVLEYETSKDSMRDAMDRIGVVAAMRVGRAWSPESQAAIAGAIEDEAVRHRELRRLARRLAKKSRAEVLQLRDRAEYAEKVKDNVVARTQRLEHEIDRLEGGKLGGYKALEAKVEEAERRAIENEGRCQRLIQLFRQKFDMEPNPFASGQEPIARMTLDEAGAEDARMQERAAAIRWLERERDEQRGCDGEAMLIQDIIDHLRLGHHAASPGA